MGVAIDKGFIESIDDPISKYLKSPVPLKNPDERKKKYHHQAPFNNVERT